MFANAWDNSTELGRLYAALKARTQIEAAGMLGSRQSALSDYKRRGSIVTGNVLEKAVAIGISPEWIKNGASHAEAGVRLNKKMQRGALLP